MNPDTVVADFLASRADAAPAGGEADADSLDHLAPPETIQPWTGAALGAGRADRHWLPRIDYLAAGGTIATVHDDPAAAGQPTLTAEAIARSVPELYAVADIRATQFMQRPSPAISFADLLTLREEIAFRVAQGSAGVVVTQGTDTIEETAFALDLLCAGSAPIVVTGAMRSPSLPGADGPANLLAAVQVAASAGARGLGVLVVFNDEIHAARFVAKTHTSRPSAFQSRLTGPIGWLSEGRPVIAARPLGRFCLNVPSGADVPPVALVRVALDDDGRILPALAVHGFRGVVIEGFGGGHVSPAMVPRIERLAAENARRARIAHRVGRTAPQHLSLPRERNRTPRGRRDPGRNARRAQGANPPIAMSRRGSRGRECGHRVPGARVHIATHVRRSGDVRV